MSSFDADEDNLPANDNETSTFANLLNLTTTLNPDRHLLSSSRVPSSSSTTERMTTTSTSYETSTLPTTVAFTATTTPPSADETSILNETEHESTTSNNLSAFNNSSFLEVLVEVTTTTEESPVTTSSTVEADNSLTTTSMPELSLPLPYFLPAFDNRDVDEESEVTTPSPSDTSSNDGTLSSPSREETTHKPVVITRLITDDLEEDPDRLSSPYFEFESSPLTSSSSISNPLVSPTNNPPADEM